MSIPDFLRPIMEPLWNKPNAALKPDLNELDNAIVDLKVRILSNNYIASLPKKEFLSINDEINNLQLKLEAIIKGGAN
jgi:hypothetical protein